MPTVLWTFEANHMYEVMRTMVGHGDPRHPGSTGSWNERASLILSHHEDASLLMSTMFIEDCVSHIATLAREVLASMC